MSILEADHARIVAEATAEARAAERRHWEARFRNAEQAHAAALADANLRWDAEVTRALDEGEKIGRADAEQAHAAALAEERASEFARIRSLIAEHGPKGWKVCGDWALRLMDDPESGGAA